MKKGNIERAFTYLESGAVLLVTTNDKKRDNIMTISWQMVMDFSPRIAICTGAWNESFETILNEKQCCLCIPPFDLIETAVGIGMVHGSDCDKFKRFNLQKQKGEFVSSPIISDCLAAIECELEVYLEDYGILVLKGLALWENPEKKNQSVIHANGDGTFFSDGELRDLSDQMREKLPDGCERFRTE